MLFFTKLLIFQLRGQAAISCRTSSEVRVRIECKNDRPKCDFVPALVDGGAGQQVLRRQVREDHGQKLVRKTLNWARGLFGRLLGDMLNVGNVVVVAVVTFLAFLSQKMNI